MIAAFAEAAWPGALLASLLLAVRHDLSEHRIPNILTALTLVVAIVLHLLADGARGALFAIQGAMVGFAVMLPFYLARGMGAGDVKLMAAIGAFFGPLGSLYAAASALMLGAVLAIVLVTWRALPRHGAHPEGVAPTGATDEEWRRMSKQKFPYAVAIAGGALVPIWQQGVLERLTAAFSG